MASALSINFFLQFSLCLWDFLSIKNCNPVAIKKRMEKDVDEVGKIARTIKLRIEELDKEVKKCVACLIVVLLTEFF